MDFEEALEILGVTNLSNFDSFKLDIKMNWKKLVIKYTGTNDKELSRVNRAYDTLRRISKDKFDEIFDYKNVEKDIFIEDHNEDLFSEGNNNSKVTYGIDTDEIEYINEDLFSEENNSITDEIRESFERFRLKRFENYQELDQENYYPPETNFNSENYKKELNDDINSEIQFDLSKTYTFKPDAKFNLLRIGASIAGLLMGSAGTASYSLFSNFCVSVTKKGVEVEMPFNKIFYPYELIKDISKTNIGVRLLLSRRYKLLKEHNINCYGNNDELYECLNFFYLNYKNDY